MKGFMLDDTGDVVIKSGAVQMVNGNELLKQTIKTILGTNKGEWPLNPDEGIAFSNVLGKGISEELIMEEIQQGLTQVDEELTLTNFTMSNVGRKYKITFTAQNSAGEEVSGEATYG